VAEVPQQIFLGTLAQSAVLIAAALTGGRLSDRTGRRKIFVFSASIVYGLALFVVAQLEMARRRRPLGEQHDGLVLLRLGDGVRPRLSVCRIPSGTAPGWPS